MEMLPYSFDGSDTDWYGALDSFPPLCSSFSPLDISEKDNLPIAVAPLGPQSLGNPLLTDDSSSSEMIQRDEDNYHLPMFSAPAPPAAGDPFYFDRLPPSAADGATAGLDDALLLEPLSDIDLDAFCGIGTDLHKAPPLADNMMDVRADRYAAGQDAGVDGRGDDQNPMPTIADYYRPAEPSVGFDVAVMHHGEHHHQQISVAALRPPPMARPQVRRSSDGSASAAGKTKLDHIGFDEIRKYFYMPITKAAREMNVGLTVLKKRCRELGVARWPHRKMKSLKSLIQNVQEMGKDMSPAAVQQELAALETYCALMEEDPSIELTDRTKKLRQACFKESYKRRRAAGVNSVIDQIYNFGHDQRTLQETDTAGHSLQSSQLFGY